MKKTICIIAGIALLGLTSCKNENDKKEADDQEVTEVKTEKITKTDASSDKNMVRFRLLPKSNSGATGRVSFKEKDGMVTFEAVINGLEPGMHAIHIHENADCSAEDGTSAGGHWNPTFEDHGKWGDTAGYHKGDIGNFEANDQGQGTITMTTDQWCIGCGDEKKDILGKSIIVHQGADDFTSQPSGAAGARVSCGGIIK
ncbi:MAG: superoxide dismutase family protein [Marinirhabdus sp.]|nr:superoxide dismutase family protein [Marinirhabdus sp.]